MSVCSWTRALGLPRRPEGPAPWILEPRRQRWSCATHSRSAVIYRWNLEHSLACVKIRHSKTSVSFPAVLEGSIRAEGTRGQSRRTLCQIPRQRHVRDLMCIRWKNGTSTKYIFLKRDSIVSPGFKNRPTNNMQDVPTIRGGADHHVISSDD